VNVIRIYSNNEKVINTIENLLFIKLLNATSSLFKSR